MNDEQIEEEVRQNTTVKEVLKFLSEISSMSMRDMLYAAAGFDTIVQQIEGNVDGLTDKTNAAAAKAGGQDRLTNSEGEFLNRAVKRMLLAFAIYHSEQFIFTAQGRLKDAPDLLKEDKDIKTLIQEVREKITDMEKRYMDGEMP